jgi:hypothetical protein
LCHICCSCEDRDTNQFVNSFLYVVEKLSY